MNRRDFLLLTAAAAAVGPAISEAVEADPPRKPPWFISIDVGYPEGGDYSVASLFQVEGDQVRVLSSQRISDEEVEDMVWARTAWWQQRCPDPVPAFDSVVSQISEDDGDLWLCVSVPPLPPMDLSEAALEQMVRDLQIRGSAFSRISYTPTHITWSRIDDPFKW